MKNGKIVNGNGNIRYYKDDKLHREDGPAIEYRDGDKFWFINGERHREDGPAIEYANGSKEWFINDICYTEKDYWIKIEQLKLGIFKPFFSKEDFKIE